MAVNDWAEGYLAIKLNCPIVGEEIKELHVGPFPAMTNWGPLHHDPVITDLITGGTLVVDVDFYYADTGQLYPIVCLPVTRWLITYRPGYLVPPGGLVSVLAAIVTEAGAGGAEDAGRLGDLSWSGTAEVAEKYLDLLEVYRRYP